MMLALLKNSEKLFIKITHIFSQVFNKIIDKNICLKKVEKRIDFQKSIYMM